MIYCLSNLVLECFCGVYCRSLEVVFVYEILYFGIVLLNGEYNYGIPFIGCCYHSIVILKFSLYLFCSSGFSMIGVLMIGFILKF